MMSLCLIRLKPNPKGKDRTPDGKASATQLAGEWVDITNVGVSSVNLSGIRLEHKAYRSTFNWDWKEIGTFGDIVLSPQSTLRVHSGPGPESVLSSQDRNGADIHCFSGSNYVWNNQKSDSARLITGKTVVDQATYEPNPPEGVVLQRRGTKLIPDFRLQLSRLLKSQLGY